MLQAMAAGMMIAVAMAAEVGMEVAEAAATVVVDMMIVEAMAAEAVEEAMVVAEEEEAAVSSFLLLFEVVSCVCFGWHASFCVCLRQEALPRKRSEENHHGSLKKIRQDGSLESKNKSV